jgi:hypothetical protein
MPQFSALNPTWQIAGQLNWTHTFSSTTLNDASAGMSRVEGLLGSGAKDYTVPSITVNGINVDSNQAYGVGFAQGDFIQHNYHWRDVLTHVKGAHTLKFGYEGWYGDDVEPFQGPWSQPKFAFDNLLKLAQDDPTNEGGIMYDPATGTQKLWNWDAASRTFGLFVQDTWKVNRKLTLDYGIRFSHTTPFDQTDDRGSIFDPTTYVRGKAPRQYVPAIVNGLRVGLDPVTRQTVSAALISAFVPGTGDIANGIVKQTDANVPRGFLESKALLIMPRFGFAYDPFGDGKTAIRGGAGVFYQTEDDGFFVGQAMVTNPPYILTANAFNANISQLGIGLGSIFPANVIGLDRSSTRPSTYNFSMGVQRDIGRKTILDVKYVGSLSRHLGARRNINTIPFGTRFQAQNIDTTAAVANTPFVDNLLRPYPGYGNITMAEKNLSSNYNSLQATLNRRFARGFECGSHHRVDLWHTNWCWNFQRHH